MFLRNYWYVAAWDHEVGREPLGRTFLGDPVVMFRKLDGTPVAFEDRCCHRRAPLSLGRVVEDTLQCGYHGLVYDATGQVIAVRARSPCRRARGSSAIPWSSAGSGSGSGWAIRRTPTMR